MKAASLAAVALVLMLGAPVFAQESSSTVASGAASAEGAGSVITLIGGSGENQVDLSGIGEGTNVSVVLLSTVQPDAAENLDDLTSAVEANAISIAELRSSIASNEVLSAQISETCEVENVLAVVTIEDGSYMVYCDDLTAKAGSKAN